MNLIDDYVPERTRETKQRETKHIKGMNFEQQVAAFDEIFETDPNEPYGDLNRLTDAMSRWEIEMMAQNEYPDEAKPDQTPQYQKILTEIEHDIQTYLETWSLTWRNKYWEKREFLRKLSESDCSVH